MSIKSGSSGGGVVGDADPAIPAEAPSPRLCHLIKWPDFDGFGFNLHADKSKPGQFIGKVDAASPAEAAGLREHDRIIEVNGVNIANENHRQVVQRIKAIPDETRLLVVDRATDGFYRQRSIVPKSGHGNVVTIKTPPTSQDAQNRKQSNGNITAVEERKSSTNGVSSVDGNRNGRQSIDKHAAAADNQKMDNDLKHSNSREDEITAVVNGSNGVTSSASTASSSSSTGTADCGEVKGQQEQQSGMGGGGGLNLNMTAQEMRAALADRKKRDPKKEQIDLRKKYDIIQSL